MKTKRLAFLFFYFLFSNVFTILSQEQDSISYYVKSYKKAQNSDQVYKALTFFQKEKEQALSLGYSERAAYFMYHVAAIDLRFESLYESERVAVEALEILDSLEESIYTRDYKLSLYNHLGILKRRQNDYKSSFEYYDKSLTFSPSKRDSALAFNNMSVAHIDMKEYQKAKQKLLFAVNNFRVIKDSLHIALALNNLGHVKDKLNEKGGLDDLKESLEIRKRIKDPKIYESYRNIVRYYEDQQNRNLAIQYAKEGYRMAKSAVDLSYRFEAIKSLINLDQKGYERELVDVLGQIDSIRKQNDIKYSAAKYNFSNEQKARKQAELETQKEKSQKTTYQILGGFILIFSIAIIIILRIRNRKNTLKKQFETEQRIARTLHDEVANTVFYTMFQVQTEDVSENELLDNLEDIYVKIRDISKSNAEVDVSRDYEILIDDLIMRYITKGINVIKDSLFHITWNEISGDKKRVLYRVIQELMTNMRKHSGADLVTFSFEKKGRKLEVKYADNGRGCVLKKGNGLQNVESRIKMVNGQVIFDSEVNDGFYVRIKL